MCDGPLWARQLFLFCLCLWVCDFQCFVCVRGCFHSVFQVPIINHPGGVSVSYKNPALPGFMKPGNTLSVASTDTRYPKLPSLGKANEKASNTRRLYWTT